MSEDLTISLFFFLSQEFLSIMKYLSLFNDPEKYFALRARKGPIYLPKFMKITKYLRSHFLPLPNLVRRKTDPPSIFPIVILWPTATPPACHDHFVFLGKISFNKIKTYSPYVFPVAKVFPSQCLKQWVVESKNK